MKELNMSADSEIDSNLEVSKIVQNDDSDSETVHKSFKCEQLGCSATFSKASKLTIHVRQHTGERPYKCDYEGCDKSYTNASHLKRHSQTHEVVKQSFKCPECSMMISNRQNLKRHYDRAHSGNTPFSCKECGLKFNKEQKYKEHEAVHKGVALYECTVCQRRCTTLSNFRKHEKSHEQEKEYSCDAENCSAVFNKWSLLCKHKNRKHTNEYKCKDCDKVFLNKSQLKSHSSIHQDDRSILPCPYEKCPRFYFFKRNLDHHVRTSHLGKKYHCDVCDIKLSSKQKITEHISKIHLAKKKKKKKKTLNKSARKRRRDAGATKKSMLTKLVGLELPGDIEKELMYRKTRIHISDERSVEHLDKSDGAIEIAEQISTNSFNEPINDKKNDSFTGVEAESQRVVNCSECAEMSVL